MPLKNKPAFTPSVASLRLSLTIELEGSSGRSCDGAGSADRLSLREGKVRSTYSIFLFLIESCLICFSVEAQTLIRCNSGRYCLLGTQCLKDGACGELVGGPCALGDVPGRGGGCIPEGYVDCGPGRGFCRPGQHCTPTGCAPGYGGGPQCGSRACVRGEKCAFGRRCYDPRTTGFCGTTACNLKQTCGQFDECLNIGARYSGYASSCQDRSDLVQITLNPTIKAAMNRAWALSYADDDCPSLKRCRKKEHGFWILSVTGQLQVYWVAPGKGRTLEPGDKPSITGQPAIAIFHTHPFKRTDQPGDWSAEPTKQDKGQATLNGVSGLLASHEGLQCYGRRGILVTSATYGASCGQPAGNVTEYVSSTCNREDTCKYHVQWERIGDPAPGCKKDFSVQWVCSNGTAGSAYAPAEAGYGSIVTLKCSDR
jgi:hypothetical protein